MKILHLAYSDSSGVPSRWAQAHRDTGHQATLLLELPHEYRYHGGSAIMRWTERGPSLDRLEPFLRGVDAVMAYDHPYYLRAAIETGKPVMFRALGHAARTHHEEIHELLQAPNVIRATAGLAEIATLLDIDLVGAPYPLLTPARPRGDLVLCHAPANRHLKQTEMVLRAAEATGWTVDLVENVTNAAVLERKQRCHLVVDSGPGGVPDGYGVNSIEAMAMGLPAVSGASHTVRAQMAEVGSPVWLVSDEAELRDVLGELHDPDLRRDLGAAGRFFVERFHSAATRATEDMQALERVAVAG